VNYSFKYGSGVEENKSEPPTNYQRIRTPLTQTSTYTYISYTVRTEWNL